MGCTMRHGENNTQVDKCLTDKKGDRIEDNII